MSVALYTRVSSVEQGTSGLSLEAQAATCREYAATLLREPNPVLFVEKKSAASLAKRPVLSGLLNDLVGYEHLVVLRLDRLARNTYDLLSILKTLDEKQVAFHSVRERLDTHGATGRLFTTLLGAMAQFERDLISQRTVEALAAKKMRGEWLGKIPFGFSDRQLTPHENNLAIVRTCFLLRKAHASLRDIARLVSLPLATVRHVLGNPIYRARHLL